MRFVGRVACARQRSITLHATYNIRINQIKTNKQFRKTNKQLSEKVNRAVKK